MPDKFSKEVRSKIMSRIRGKNTSLEKGVFGDLRRSGIYFRKHYRGAVGSPDVAFPAKKIAVFIDGDFWHGYRYPAWKKKPPSKFWRDKIERNRARDKRTFAKLRYRGWRVVRIWEHELKKDRIAALSKILALVRK